MKLNLNCLALKAVGKTEMHSSSAIRRETRNVITVQASSAGIIYGVLWRAAAPNGLIALRIFRGGRQPPINHCDHYYIYIFDSWRNILTCLLKTVQLYQIRQEERFPQSDPCCQIKHSSSHPIIKAACHSAGARTNSPRTVFPYMCSPMLRLKNDGKINWIFHGKRPG